MEWETRGDTSVLTFFLNSTQNLHENESNQNKTLTSPEDRGWIDI